MNPSVLNRKYYLYNCNGAIQRDASGNTIPTYIFSYIPKTYNGYRYSYHARHNTCDLDVACSLLRLYKIPFNLKYYDNKTCIHEHWIIEFRQDIKELTRVYRLLVGYNK